MKLDADTQRFVGFSAAVAAGLLATAYGYGQVSKRLPNYRKQKELLKEYEQMLLPPRAAIKKLEDDILKQMNDGLAKQGGSTIMMLPTYVLQLPTGDEKGGCYAIDVGGTNFRVVYVKLSDKHSEVDEIEMEQVAIPIDKYTGRGTELFDFLAQNVKDFIDKHQASKNGRSSQQEEPVIGFCFSFAVDQLALDSGKLVGWTKGFTAEGVVGNDVVKMLSDALVRVGRPSRVLALINDTVGVLTASRYVDPATEIGVIFGTGTNAAIVEKVSKFGKWQPDHIPKDTLTAVNTEWGAYSSPLLPRAQEDMDLDNASVNAGQQQIEKMMSGMYLGEVTRRILVTFAKKASLFGPKPPLKLSEVGSFTTANLADIETDHSPLRTRVAAVLKESLGVSASVLNVETLYLVQSICRLVARRSARVAAALLVATLRQQGWMENPRRLTIAVDGGVILKYSSYRHFIDEYMKELLGDRAGELFPLIDFKPVRDGSSVGAAVVAAAAAQDPLPSTTA